MRRQYVKPTGQLAARLHGAIAEMRERAQSAGDFSTSWHIMPEQAAALRGKATAYREAADLLEAIDKGYRIPKRRRWTGWTPTQRDTRPTTEETLP